MPEDNRELGSEPADSVAAQLVRLEQADLVKRPGPAGQNRADERRHPHAAAAEDRQLHQSVSLAVVGSSAPSARPAAPMPATSISPTAPSPATASEPAELAAASASPMASAPVRRSSSSSFGTKMSARRTHSMTVSR